LLNNDSNIGERRGSGGVVDLGIPPLPLPLWSDAGGRDLTNFICDNFLKERVSIVSTSLEYLSRPYIAVE
jgi:hypothetical protein